MSNNQDPRNIFVQQREQYFERQTVTEQDSQQQPKATPKSTEQRKAQSTPNQDDYASRVEEMKRLAAKYEREGEGQLVRDIVTNVIEQKARGNLTNDQLIAFAKRVSPLLNAEQRTRLNGLLEELLKL